MALRCDITDEKSVRSAIKETVKELGGIDILVNNAANYETAEFERSRSDSGTPSLPRTLAVRFWFRARR